MEKEAMARNNISSIQIVESPKLIIELSKTDAGAPTIVVDGMPPAVAMEIPWEKVIGVLADLIFGGGGGGGGGGGKGDGCTTITIKNPDGSSTEIKQCPAPK